MDEGNAAVWICRDRHWGARARRPNLARRDDWHLHVLGCVRLTRMGGVTRLDLDGRLFDGEICERLLVELERHRSLTSRIDFRVYTGPAAGDDGWIRHSVAGLAEARRFARLVVTVGTAADAAFSIRSTPMQLERLLMERRGIFDEVLAAWLLNRTPGNPTLRRLFDPARDDPDEGLKVVRRFGDNLAFDAYRAPSGHLWVEDQRARMSGADLGAVFDRRLARSLLAAVDGAQRAGEPQLERVSGVFVTAGGRQFAEYYRLTLPLNDDDTERARSVLIATRW